jgi:hypothetical protein
MPAVRGESGLECLLCTAQWAISRKCALLAYAHNKAAVHADEKKGEDGQPNPSGTVLRAFVKHMQALHSARAALLSRGATCQVCGRQPCWRSSCQIH